jgi:glycosyltransferase involved in cell wall biosynthesis
MKVSVVVPVFEYYDRGVEFLDDMLRTISYQTLKEVEVVISDHSLNNVIKDYCEKNEYNLNIKYFKNPNDRGNCCANTNAAIKKSSGEIIKVFLQDDFLYDTTALEKMHSYLMESEKTWLVCGCIHTRDDGNTFYHPIYPRWSDNMILSENNNFIGSPSVLAFKNQNKVKFDENVAMLMDVDFYYNMFLTYGQAIYLDDILVGIRVRDHDTWQQSISQEKVDEEFKYVYKKYSINS